MRVLRVLFEVFSAVFVVAALITLVYSEHRLGRALAGLGLIIIVSAATTSMVLRLEARQSRQ